MTFSSGCSGSSLSESGSSGFLYSYHSSHIVQRHRHSHYVTGYTTPTQRFSGYTTYSGFALVVYIRYSLLSQCISYQDMPILQSPCKHGRTVQRSEWVSLLMEGGSCKSLYTYILKEVSEALYHRVGVTRRNNLHSWHANASSLLPH